MTQREWLNSVHPRPMLWFLGSTASERRLRLFVVACCRRIGKLATDARSRRSVEVAEQFADHFASDAELQEAHRDARQAVHEVYERCKRAIIAVEGDYGAGYHQHGGLQDACAASDACFDASASFSDPHRRMPGQVAEITVRAVGHAVDPQPHELFPRRSLARQTAEARERSCQAALMRDIFGNPFRVVAIDRRWRTSSVIDLASAIYQERAFDRMPILADALMDAGCDSEAIIAHCQQPCEHVRGCWVVDLLLGKE